MSAHSFTSIRTLPTCGEPITDRLPFNREPHALHRFFLDQNASEPATCIPNRDGWSLLWEPSLSLHGDYFKSIEIVRSTPYEAFRDAYHLVLQMFEAAESAGVRI